MLNAGNGQNGMSNSGGQIPQEQQVQMFSPNNLSSGSSNDSAGSGQSGSVPQQGLLVQNSQQSSQPEKEQEWSSALGHQQLQQNLSSGQQQQQPFFLQSMMSGGPYMNMQHMFGGGMMYMGQEGMQMHPMVPSNFTKMQNPMASSSPVPSISNSHGRSKKKMKTSHRSAKSLRDLIKSRRALKRINEFVGPFPTTELEEAIKITNILPGARFSGHFVITDSHMLKRVRFGGLGIMRGSCFADIFKAINRTRIHRLDLDDTQSIELAKLAKYAEPERKGSIIGPDNLAVLWNALRTPHCPLEELNADGTDAGASHGYRALGAALALNTKLLVLKLDDTSDDETSTQDCKELADALRQNAHLQSFSFAGNRIGSAGCIAFASAIHFNSALTSLNLEANGIGEDGCAAIADMLRINTTLRKLGLARNTEIGEEGCRLISDALRLNETLEELDLEQTNIGLNRAAGVRALASGLKRNKSLKVLILTDNDLGANASEYLSKLLKSNSTLTSLTLSKNRIGFRALKSLIPGLITNNSLVFLNLTRNPLTAPCYEQLEILSRSKPNLAKGIVL